MTTDAKLLAYSSYKKLPPVITMSVVMPRIVMPGITRHRDFSFSIQSSRAVPTDRMIEAIRKDPFVPDSFLTQVPGMAGGEPLDDKAQEMAERVWRAGVEESILRAERLNEIGAAKEHINRVLEPYVHVAAIITSTSWKNFFDLRLAEGVQPELRDLARKMSDAIAQAEPRKLADGDWHLPLITEVERAHPDASLISAARCARISYLTRVPSSTDLVADVNLASRLVNMRHWSPFEHQARGFMGKDRRNKIISRPNRNLAKGWLQLRGALDGKAA